MHTTPAKRNSRSHVSTPNPARIKLSFSCIIGNPITPSSFLIFSKRWFFFKKKPPLPDQKSPRPSPATPSNIPTIWPVGTTAPAVKLKELVLEKSALLVRLMALVVDRVDARLERSGALDEDEGPGDVEIRDMTAVEGGGSSVDEIRCAALEKGTTTETAPVEVGSSSACATNFVNVPTVPRVLNMVVTRDEVLVLSVALAFGSHAPVPIVLPSCSVTVARPFKYSTTVGATKSGFGI